MDLRAVVTLSTLLLVTAEPDQAKVNETSTPHPNIGNTSEECPCPCVAPAATAAPTSTPSVPPPALGFLTVSWTADCKGDVFLNLYHPSSSSSSSLPVCHQSQKNIQSTLVDVCQRKGCKDKPRWHTGSKTPRGYHVNERGAEEEASCETLRVHCTVEVLEDVQGKLQAYKVVVALLCCVLLVVLLIRFTRPTVKALQKKLSDRRQNRWIGPTQSHSVSYHRGKTAIRCDDGEKHLSYPGLERLAIPDSREPSSNRNSDYNF